MTNSISSILNNYDYTKNLNGSQTDASNNQNTYAQIFADLLKQSESGVLDSTGVQSDPLLSSANYDTTTGASGLSSLLSASAGNSAGTNSTLTADALQPYLSSLLGQGLSTDSSSSDPTSSANTVDPSLGNSPFGFDLTSVIDSQIQSILNKNTSQSSDPKTQVQNAASTQQTNSGFPTNLQLSGSVLPPFNWKPSTTA